MDTRPCFICNGSGSVLGATCIKCSGLGQLERLSDHPRSAHRIIGSTTERTPALFHDDTRGLHLLETERVIVAVPVLQWVLVSQIFYLDALNALNARLQVSPLLGDGQTYLDKSEVETLEYALECLTQPREIVTHLLERCQKWLQAHKADSQLLEAGKPDRRDGPIGAVHPKTCCSAQEVNP